MEILCKGCKTKFRIPDEKIPKDKVLSVTCPKCKNKITVSAKAQAESDESPQDPSREARPTKTNVSPPTLTPEIDEAKVLFFGEDIKTALVCDDLPENQDILQKALKELDYHVQVTTTAEGALDKIRFNRYDAIILNEEFAGCSSLDNPILKQIQPMPMATRRDIFFALIGKEFRTFDNMIAFSKSANLVINADDLTNIKKILNNALAENEKFYKVFKEILKEAGKR
jgi:predicted Zn finger-like uncharacterized protein